MDVLRKTILPVVLCHILLLGDSSEQVERGSIRNEWDGWSNWGTWTPCSQRCGQGLSARERRCETSPSTTTNHIGNCQGLYKQYKICQGQNCIEGQSDYRTEQCARYNHKIYIGKRYDWVPFVNPNNQCELSCRADGFKFYAKFAPMVPDGMSCFNGLEEGACVSGKCQGVGCDGIVGSSARKDQCGVCKGDNSTCRIISGIFMRPHLRYGYTTISKIPAGSCNINITETKISNNFLALKKSGGDYIFNGNFRPSSSGQYKAVGTIFTYSRSPNHLCPGQCIFASGPTNRTIDLELLAYRRNPGIRYSFTVPLDMVDKVMTDMLSTGTTKSPSHQATSHHRHRHQGSSGSSHRTHQRNHNQSPGQSPRIQHRTAPKRVGDTNQADRAPSFGAQALQLAGPNPQPTQTSNRHRPTSNRNVYNSYNRDRYVPSSSSSYTRHNLLNNHRRRPSSTSQRYPASPNRLQTDLRTRLSTRHNSHSVIPQQPSVSFTRGSSVRQHSATHRRLNFGQQPRYIPPYDSQQQQRLSYNYGNGGLNANRYNPPRYIPPETPRRQALDLNSHNPTFPSQNSVLETNKAVPSRFDSQGQPYIDDALNPLSNKASDIVVQYSWRVAGFTECSASCAGGTQQTRVVCMKGNSEVVVTDDNCDPITRPSTNAISCNSVPCPPEWFTDEWGLCSTTCGQGTQSRLVECRKKISETISVSVSADLCLGQTRPVSFSQCNFKPCSSWKIGDWSTCSADCGLGQRTREITCVGASEEKLPSSHCQDVRPPSEEVCDMGSCAKDWFFTRWPKECSSECGEGFYERKVFCSADDGSTLPESKCPAHKPRIKKHCKHEKPCGGQWFGGPWSGCSATCGIAMRRRDVICMKKISSTHMSPVDQVNCLKEERPVSQEQCADLGPCPPEWFITEWGECSASCGTGLRSRELKCLYPSLKVSQECEEKSKPSTRQSCNRHSCHRPQLDKDPDCKDKYASFCVMVVQARLCSYSYYKDRCCLSCRNHS